ncbi:MAG: hypothetical protein ACP5RX_01770 [Minisyncoccia bacterium]
MTEKELIEQLKQLQNIKPNENWADWLLSNILSKSPNVIASEAYLRRQAKQSQSRVTLASFSFLRQYQKALVSAVFITLFVSTFVLAQNTLPGNPLYPVKTFTQNIRIALAPTDYKPVVRMQVAKSRLQDISQTHQKDNIALLSQNVQKDLETIPKELKNIQNKNKVLTYSKQIQTEAKNLKDIISQAELQPQEKEALEKTSQDTQNQVLSLIIDTQDQINNCPTYLKDKLAQLQKDFTNQEQNLINWSPDDINKVRVLVSDIDNDLKAGNCLEAIDKIESINQILQIHSLDTTTSLGK